MSERTNQLSRRDVLKLLGKGVFVTTAMNGFAVTTNILGASEQESLLQQQEVALHKASEQERRFQVSNFTGDIVTASKRITHDLTPEYMAGLVISGFVGTVLGDYFLQRYPNKIKRIIGAVSGVTGKTVDIISTLATVGYYSDRRFKEYGLDNYFGETNPLFPLNPSAKDLISTGAMQDVVMGIGGAIFPFIGTGYLTASPVIAGNNYEIANEISLSLKLGDKVKSLIEDHRSANFIQTYLQKIQLNRGRQQQKERLVRRR